MKKILLITALLAVPALNAGGCWDGLIAAVKSCCCCPKSDDGLSVRYHNLDDENGSNSESEDNVSNASESNNDDAAAQRRRVACLALDRKETGGRETRIKKFWDSLNSAEKERLFAAEIGGDTYFK